MKKTENALCGLADKIPCGNFLLGIISLICASVVFKIEVALLSFIGIAIHEVGHALIARLHQIPVKGIYVFPTIGGIIPALPNLAGRCVYGVQIKCWKVGSRLTASGPIFTILFAILLLLTGVSTKCNVLIFGALINSIRTLRDLIPRGKNDGHLILRAIKTKQKNSGMSSIQRLKLGIIYFGLCCVTITVLAHSVWGCSLSHPEDLFQPAILQAIDRLINAVTAQLG